MTEATVQTLRALAEMFSESVHETWTREEIVNIIEDAIRLGTGGVMYPHRESPMKLKRYCVTVMDNWTPMRDFWTYKGALAFRNEHLACAHLHQWFNRRWVEIKRPPIGNKNPCPGCDGHECDDGCAYPGALAAVSSPKDPL